MKSSRREFLKRGTLGALSAGVPLAFSAKAAGLSNAPATATGLNLAAFKSQLGTTFIVNDETAKVKVTLVKVASFASRKESAGGKEGFSLRFRGSQEMPLKQNTYVIEHEQLGLFSFLIVPIGTKDTRSPYYEAVINRLHF
jgi:hypothetical protein